MTAPDAHWIPAAQRGDAQAFRHLVEAHARPLHRVCARILGDSAAAEDALQDAFIAAWRALPDFDGRSAFGSWLHRIAVNAALGQLRGRRGDTLAWPETEEPPSQLLPDTGEDPLQHTSVAQFGARLGEALERLSVAERSAFVLRHFEQHSLEEIAHALGGNVNSTKQAIFRAVRKLRDALSPMRSEP